MNTNNIVFSILCGLFSFNSFAQYPSCPVLTGEYVCAQNTPNPYRLQITETPIGSTMAFDFNSAADGLHRFTSDGVPHEMQSGFGKGTYSSLCVNGWLVSTILLTRPDGNTFNVRDRLQKQRGAVVSIREALPGMTLKDVKLPEVFKCRPYFARP